MFQQNGYVFTDGRGGRIAIKYGMKLEEESKMGLFNHHQERITINGQEVSVSELVDRYNQLVQQVTDLKEATKTLDVDGQQMTASNVQSVVDQWQNATAQAKSAAAQVAKLKDENAALRAAQSIKMDDKTITVDELIDRYNDLLKQLQQAQNKVAELEDQLDEPASLTVNGEEMTADDVQGLIDEREDATERAKSAADQVAELTAKNAALAKDAQAARSISIAGKPITVDEMMEHYNGPLEEYQQARNENHQLQNQLSDLRMQIDEDSTTLTVNGQEMTADDVQDLIDERQDATDQAKSAADQVAELTAKNAELTKKAQAAQSISIAGKPVTVNEMMESYNDLLEEYKQLQSQNKQLQAELRKPATLTVNGQEMTADSVQELIDERQDAADQAEAAAAQVTALNTKNAELTRDVQAAQDQVKQLQSQLAKGSTTLTVDGRELTADGIQELIDQWQNRLKKAEYQLKMKDLDLQNAKQAGTARPEPAAQAVTVNGEQMPVAELVKRYCHLLRQKQSQPQTQPSFRPAPRSQATQPAREAATSGSNADREKLIDRYYQVVQTVLGDYQDQVAKLQRQLTEYLKDNGQVEFLQLTKNNVTPSTYQKMFQERNQQMIRYVENHQHQEELVRPKDQKTNPHDELRGVRYWGNFVYRYRWVLSRLLDQNDDDHRNFKFAYRYAKPTAKRIGESKPAYLTVQNVRDLRTIQSGIKDEQAWDKNMKKFFEQVNNTSKGDEGERLVRNVVGSSANNRVLSSLNLPYQYRKGEDNSNQIDCIVVNQKGIFILEIKNYTADKIGIDRDGFIVVEKNGRKIRYKNIIKQGQFHYKAVLNNLEEDELTKPYVNYLKKNLHVLYVSTNPHAVIQPAYPNANPHYHFIGLDGLRNYIDSARGQLRPEVIKSVAEVIGNLQQAEKQRDYVCFPSNPGKRAEDGWQQLTIMRQLLNLKLDDFVDRHDPDIRQELAMEGLTTCDGYVTSKPHSKKKA